MAAVPPLVAQAKLLAAHFPESAEQPCQLIPDQPVVHYDDHDAASARFAHALTEAGARRGDRRPIPN